MRALPVMRLARALAGWVGDEPIPIADGWQAPETKLDAARALGLVAEDGTLTDEITRRVNWIYEIAFHAGYSTRNTEPSTADGGRGLRRQPAVLANGRTDRGGHLRRHPRDLAGSARHARGPPLRGRRTEPAGAGRDFWDNPLPGLEPIHCDSAVMASHGIIAAYEGSKDPAESQGRCARKPAGPPRPPCSGRCGGPGTKWPTRRLPSSASTTRTKRPRKPPAPPSTRHPQPGYRRRPMDPSSPALEADGLRQHVRSVLQVREAPGQRRDS